MKILAVVTILLVLGLTAPSNLFPSGLARNVSLLRPDTNQGPRKVDEYGDLIQDDEGARLDVFEKELRKEPESKGYIIAYVGRQDPPGKARRYTHRAKLYLVKVRGIEAARIVLLDGGLRDSLTVELWVVPPRASAPVPTSSSTVDRMDDRKALKYDEYSFGYEFSWNSYEVPSVRLDGFAALLRKDSGARAYVVVYAQNGDDRRNIDRDPPSTARTIAENEKAYLIEKAGIDRSRIVAANGGHSDQRTVTLWIVPPGASPPRLRRARPR